MIRNWITFIVIIGLFIWAAILLLEPNSSNMKTVCKPYELAIGDTLNNIAWGGKPAPYKCLVFYKNHPALAYNLPTG